MGLVSPGRAAASSSRIALPPQPPVAPLRLAQLAAGQDARPLSVRCTDNAGAGTPCLPAASDCWAGCAIKRYLPRRLNIVSYVKARLTPLVTAIEFKSHIVDLLKGELGMWTYLARKKQELAQADAY